MFKNMISPVQAWLLSQKRCVGCGTPLSTGIKNNKKGNVTVTCKCQRVYIYDANKKTYRRALLTEI
jgi:hypothetical protein